MSAAAPGKCRSNGPQLWYVGWYEGNYQAYIEDLKRRKGADADQPHRIAYKKLVRA